MFTSKSQCAYSVEITARPSNAFLWFKYAVMALIFAAICAGFNFLFICSTLVVTELIGFLFFATHTEHPLHEIRSNRKFSSRFIIVLSILCFPPPKKWIFRENHEFYMQLITPLVGTIHISNTIWSWLVISFHIYLIEQKQTIHSTSWFLFPFT